MKNIKNIIIVSLMVTAIVQLSNIWNINVQNFFATDYTVAYDEEIAQEILLPSNVLVKENDIFRVAYNTSIISNTSNSELNLLKSIAESGVLIETINETSTLEELTAGADVIYKYASIVDSNLINDVFGYKSTQFSKHDVSFDNLFINQSSGEVYCYNSVTEEVLGFIVSDLNIATSYNYNKNVGFVYNEKDINFLIPVVIDYDYYNLVETNPYSENGELLVSTIEAKINKYFKSPNEKWTIFGEDAKIFSGEDITVKYYNNNILEYNNSYESSNKKTNIAEAYAIAKSFIASDELVINDLVLKEIKKSENSFIFCFNPIINSTEIVFDDEDLDYYIEVEVNNGIVRQYKKYVMNYDVDYSVVNNIEPFDVLALEEHFDSIVLVYLQNMEELTAKLCWAKLFGEEIIYTEAD